MTATTEAIVKTAIAEPDTSSYRIQVTVPGYELALKVPLTISDARTVSDFIVTLLAAYELRAVSRDVDAIDSHLVDESR